MQVSIHQTQVLYPELGSLESRVSKFYLDELFANTGPDLEETAYWFHTPEDGWIQGETTMKAAPEAPVTFADPSHEDWEAEGRVSDHAENALKQLYISTLALIAFSSRYSY